MYNRSIGTAPHIIAGFQEETLTVKRKLVIALTVLLLPSAFVLAQDVRYNFDQQADFSKYKTYKWENHADSVEIDTITLGQLNQVFDAELAKKGLTKKEDSADLVIVYQVGYREEEQVTTYSNWDTGPYWGRRWYGATRGSFATYTTTSTSTIPIGAVSLDFYDAGNHTLVWRGQMSKTIDPDAKPEKRIKNMAKAAEKLLKNYPPKKAK